MALTGERVAKGYVEILPEISPTFNAKLKAIVKSIPKINVPVNIDTNQAQKQLDKVTQKTTLNIHAVLDLKDVNRDLDKLQAQWSHSLQIHTELENLAQVTAQLEAWGAKQSVQLEATLDLAKAETEIARLNNTDVEIALALQNENEVRAKLSEVTKDLKVKAQLELESAQAKLELARITRGQTADVSVELQNVEKAKATLAWLTRDRKVEVKTDVDVSGLGIFQKVISGALEALGGLGKMFSAAAGMAQALVDGIGAIVKVIKGLAGAAAGAGEAAGSVIAVIGETAATGGLALVLVAVLAAVVALTGGLMLLVGAIAAYIASAVIAGTVSAILVSVMAGLAAAFALASSGALALGGAIGVLALVMMPVVKAFQAFMSLQDSTAKSGTAVAKAQTAAARQVQSASQAVVRARRAELDAEKGLMEARKQAQRQLEDLANATKEGALSEEDAILSLEEARQRYNEVVADPGASELDRKRANLNVREAESNLERIRKGNKRNAEDLADAQKKGIEGSDLVVAAQQRQLDAAEGLANAQQQLTQAQEDGAASIARAAGSMDEYNAALKALSPAGLEFVGVLQQIYKMLEPISKILQEATLAGFTKALKTASALFGTMDETSGKFVEGPLMPFLKDIGKALSDVAENFSTLFSDPTVIDAIKNLLVQSAALIKLLGPAFSSVIKDLIVGFSDFMKTMSPVFDIMAQGIKDVGPSLKALFQAFNPDDATGMGKAIKSIFSIINKSIDRLGPFLDVMTTKGGDFLTKLEGPLLRLLDAFSTIMEQMIAGGALDGFIVLIDNLGLALKDLTTPGEDGVSVITRLSNSFGEIMKTLGPEIGTTIKELVKIFGDKEFIATIENFSKKFMEILGPLATVFGDIFDKDVKPEKLAADIKNLVDKILAFVKPLITNLLIALTNIVKESPEIIKAFVDMFKQLMTSLKDYYVEIANALLPLFLAVLQVVLTDPQIMLLITTFATQVTVAVIMAIAKMLKDLTTQLTQWIMDTDNIWGQLLFILTWPFTMLWNYLFGKSLFPDLLNAMTGWVGQVWGIFTGLWNILKNGFTSVKDWIVQKWDELIGWLSSLPGRVSGALSGLWNGLTESFKGAINWIIRAWNNLSLGVRVPDNFVTKALGVDGLEFSIDTPNIPQLAAGGIVDKATLAMIGEAGPEAVIPLDKLSALNQLAQSKSQASNNNQQIEKTVNVNYTVNYPAPEPASRSLPRDMRRIAATIG